MADKIIRLGLGAIVWVWLARKFGPEAFGQWNFALAFASLFGVVAGLGFDGLVQREIIQAPDRCADVVVTALVLRIAAGLVSGAICIAAAAFLKNSTPLLLFLVLANAAIIPLQAAQVFDGYFQAVQKSRIPVVAVNKAFLSSTALRLVLLWLDVSLIWLAATLVAEALLSALLLTIAYSKFNGIPKRLNFSFYWARKLFAQSWPLLLSGMTVMIYMRTDQIMLGMFLGDSEVGQFSAALRISEVWYFIPLAITTAAFPEIMRKRELGIQEYKNFIQMLYSAMAWLGLAVAVAVSISNHWLIRLLYGNEYERAADVLAIQIWAGVAVSLSYVHGKWLLAEGLQRLGFVYTSLGCVVNLTLNYFLIPRFGAEGAAWSTLATQAGLLPVQLCFPQARQNFWMMIGSFAAPMMFRKK